MKRELVFIAFALVSYGNTCGRQVSHDKNMWTCDDTQFVFCRKVDTCLDEIATAGLPLQPHECDELADQLRVCDGITDPSKELTDVRACVATLEGFECSQVAPLVASEGAKLPDACKYFFHKFQAKFNR